MQKNSKTLQEIDRELDLLRFYIVDYIDDLASQAKFKLTVSHYWRWCGILLVEHNKPRKFPSFNHWKFNGYKYNEPKLPCPIY